MAISSLLVGSYESVPAATLSIVANAVTDATQTIPAGNYYLDDPTDNLSLCKQLQEALVAHAQIGSASVYIAENRRIRVETDVACTVTWTGDTTARDLLGFTGNLSPSATTHSATNISKLLWSPGRTEIPRDRGGRAGRKVYDTKVGMSGTAIMRAAQANYTVQNEFEWRNVLNGRVWTTSEAGGEWIAFFETVLRRFWRFKLYREIDDDSGSTSPIVLASYTQLGPYKMRWTRGPLQWDYKRSTENIEQYNDIELPVVVVPELS